MALFEQTYGTSQNDINMITPAAGKKLYISYSKVETTSSGTGAKLEFASRTGDGPGGAGRFPINQVTADLIGFGESTEAVFGNVDESLKLTCQSDTTVKVIYDEV